MHTWLRDASPSLPVSHTWTALQCQQLNRELRLLHALQMAQANNSRRNLLSASFWVSLRYDVCNIFNVSSNTQLYIANFSSMDDISARCVLFFLICCFHSTIALLVTKYFAPKPNTPAAPTVSPGQPGYVDPRTVPLTTALPEWNLGDNLSMHVYLSTTPHGDVFSKQWTSGYRKDRDEGLPNFVWENITYGNYKDSRVEEFNIVFPEVRPVYRVRFIYQLQIIECPTQRLSMGRCIPHQERRKSRSSESRFQR